MIVGRRLPGGDTTASIDDVARLIEERLCELDAQLAAFEELARERDRLRRALRELRAEPDTASDGRSPRAASSSRAATRRRGGTRGAERGSTLAAISDYVRDHPGANAAEIARATGIDRALITSAAPRPANDGRLRRVPKSRRQIGYELAGESADRGA